MTNKTKRNKKHRGGDHLNNVFTQQRNSHYSQKMKNKRRTNKNFIFGSSLLTTKKMIKEKINEIIDLENTALYLLIRIYVAANDMNFVGRIPGFEDKIETCLKNIELKNLDLLNYNNTLDEFNSKELNLITEINSIKNKIDTVVVHSRELIKKFYDKDDLENIEKHVKELKYINGLKFD